MKRFHVHIVVDNVAKSINFYSKLFGQAPTKQRDDYAQWMLEDPQVNFALSTHGGTLGVDHLGLQVNTDEDLRALRAMAHTGTGAESLDADEIDCCYARSRKFWLVDPQGLAWEHFHTLSDIEDFGTDRNNGNMAFCAGSGGTATGCC